MDKYKIIELLKTYRFFRSRRLLLKMELNKMKYMDETGSEKDQNAKLKQETELSELEYKIETVETCLKLLGEYNERYKFIVESHYLNNIRIEDIADMTHVSRSRCYELCGEAVAYMSRIFFGDEQGQRAM